MFLNIFMKKLTSKKSLQMDKIKIIKSFVSQYKEYKFLSNVLGTLMMNIQVQQLMYLLLSILKSI